MDTNCSDETDATKPIPLPVETRGMAEQLTEGTEIACPLCRGETTTVKRNKRDKPYFYCAEYEAAVNMNAPVAHTESFLRQFLDGAGTAETADATGTSDATDIAKREE